MTEQPQFNHETPVVVVGAGPVGSITALKLAQLGISCMLVEKSLTTSHLPKMDLSNSTTMETLRGMGLADEYRKLAVPEEDVWETQFVTGLSPESKVLSYWKTRGDKKWKEIIRNTNDGSQPAEAPLRCSQIILEAWLKEKCIQEPLIDCHYGLKFLSLQENDEGVTSQLEDIDGKLHTVHSKYVAGCDGGSSTVRKAIAMEMVGATIPVLMYLVHFKSKELAEKRAFGPFWHVGFPDGGLMMDQDGIDTFTLHQIYPPDVDRTKLDPKEAVYTAIGGPGGHWKVNIDEIMVNSIWQPKVGCVRSFSSDNRRVFLVGDSAHLMPPHGGLSMNTGVEDALDLSWKLAAVLKGYGGPALLGTYNEERRPRLLQALDSVDGNVKKQFPFHGMAAAAGGATLNSDNEEGRKARAEINAHLQEIGDHGRYYGIELDIRVKSSIIVQDTDGSSEPAWDPEHYTPTTWPGARAPHVNLNDGATSIFDKLGLEFTLVHFTESSDKENPIVTGFEKAAKELNIPLKIATLVGEDRAQKIWTHSLVLIRPDRHVSWRGQAHELLPENHITQILRIAVGKEAFPSYVTKATSHPFFDA